MRKKILIALVAFTLSLAITSCSSDTASDSKEATTAQQDPKCDTLYDYIMNNLGYTITDLHVVNEDEGYHITINVPGTPDQLQELCEKSVSLLEQYSKNNSIQISVINPIILTSDDTAFGWSTNGTLYSNKQYPIAENITVENINTVLTENVDISAYYTPSAEETAPIADEDIKWEIVSTQDYIRDNKECIGYRIYINTEKASELQYRSIFEEITEDGKYLHTIWFYFSKSAADGSGEANVTMGQVAEGIIPLPKK